MDGNRNSYIRANFISRILLSWVSSLIRLGAKRPLDPSDFFQLGDTFTSDLLSDRLTQKWNEEKMKLQPSLGRAMYKLIRTELVTMSFLTLVQGACRLSLPWQICQLIGYFHRERSIGEHDAYYYAAGITLASLAVSISWQPYYFYMHCIGMKLRVAVTTLLYDKMIKLNYKEQRNTTSGQIINLMSNDANRLDMCMYNVHFIWLAPLETCIIMLYLYSVLGVSSLAVALVAILFLPMQALLAKLTAKYRGSIAKLTGSRIGLMAEIINTIELIKLNVWESIFIDKIKKIRRKETGFIHKASMVRASIIAPVFSSAKVMVFACLTLNAILEYVQTDATPNWLRVNDSLTPADIFLLVAICNMVRTDLVRFLPSGVQFLTEARVSVHRIQNFLLSEEHLNMRAMNSNSYCIELKNYTTTWRNNLNTETSVPRLENINLKVKNGEFVAIIGPVASGKSTLLSAIMQQLPVEYGSHMHIAGDVSLTPQTPWLFSGSIKENIEFNRVHNESDLEEALLTSALTEDILGMPLGVETQTGDAGNNLSGGQKVRLSLARSLYHDHDIYLLDDTFSALDGNISNQIFHSCLLDKLKHKTRILVTHQTKYLKYVNQIVIMKNGSIEAAGSYAELKHLFLTDDNVQLKSENKIRKTETIAEHQNISQEVEVNDTCEFVSKKKIPMSIYYKYISSGVGALVLLIAFLIDLVAMLTFTATDWWISEMANIQEESQNFTQTSRWYPMPRRHDYMYNITVYAILIITMVTSGMSNGFVWFSVFTRASAALHNRMLSCVLRVRMKFFHDNTRGRILNRFTNDIGQLDEILPLAIYDYMICVQTVILTLVICIAANFWIILPTIPLIALFAVIRQYYLLSSRNIKRIEASARSPVYSMVTSTFAGLDSIRAFKGADLRQRKQFRRILDTHSEAWFIYISVTRWLAVRLDVLCALFIGVVAFGSVLMADQLNSGLVGWTLTSAITLMGLFQYWVRQSAEVENQMTSVERILEYTQLIPEQNLDSESPVHITEDGRKWPSDGSLKSESAFLRYHQHTLALNDISFDIKSGEKIGIIGRTGAGKTSLVSMLFRLNELSSGRVLLAGEDASRIDLGILRSNMAIIPQDSMLLTGTIKENLDPLDVHSDDEIWNVLEQVHLKISVLCRVDQLRGEVGRRGDNFSVGQKQLLCLARVLLTDCRIVVIDEATANIDQETDILIQNTIKEEFQDRTVLTIAHRLNTLMTCDRIMIMDKGKIIEFDTPEKLLTKKNFEISSYIDKL